VRAIVQNGCGSPDVLEQREIERPTVADDAVLVKVRAASINAFDWGLLMMRAPHVIARLLGRAPSRVRGADVAGIVEACGRKISRFKRGDEVFGVARSAFAEYAATTEARLALKPRALSFEQAAAVPVAGCTALQGLERAQVRPGQKVIVYGAGGGTGTFAVQIAKALGAHVTAVTRTEHLALMRSIGADRVLDYTCEDFTRTGEQYDVVFDIGANRPAADYRRTLAPNGKRVLCGAPKKLGALLALIFESLVLYRRERILYTARATHEDFVRLGELVAAGKLTPVIDRTYPLSEVREAFRHFGTGRVGGKVVICVP